MKMTTVLKKHGVNIAPGTVVQGVWRKNKYDVIRRIGEGIVGSVYLVQHRGKLFALKISKQSHSITMETNVLESLQKVQGHFLGPFLLDVDDWRSPNGKVFSFYVMEYVQGESLASFLKNHGSDWLGVFLLQLLDQLQKLHEQGYIFGDLKIEHVIVELSPPTVRFIDFGGVTKRGRAIKEFTEFYDRAYWRLGTRKAEPSYDLFALVMIFIHLFHPQQFQRGKHPKQMLLMKLKETRGLHPFTDVFKKALLGRYPTSASMVRDVQKVIYHPKQTSRRQRPNHRKTEAKAFFVEVVILSFLIAIYSFLAFFAS